MRRLAVLVMMITLPAIACIAQSTYKAADIPAALKSGASAVVRDMETSVSMLGPDNVVHTVRQVITVLNKGGEGHADLALYYNKGTAIKSVKGYVLDAEGSPVGKFSLSDFRDQSAVSDFSLYEDDRLKYYSPVITSYPFTIVYEYEIRRKQNLIIPDWYPNRSPDLAVERSSYTFSHQPTDKIRMKAFNYSGKVEEKQAEKLKSYTWTVANLPAFKQEPYSPTPDDYRTYVKIVPEQFSFYKSKGSFTNWNDLGKWVYTDLVKTRQALPPATVAEVKELVQGLTSDKEKAKKVYAYMQHKTRYISVQIGLGDFQPMLASDVDRLGYGDCKALVSYMQSLLAAVDVPSYYCVVFAGRMKQDMDPEFATMDQGNHVILALPLGKDTTWLECTNQDVPFGYLGDFTDDRLVLACTETGGKLMRTPVLNPQMNETKRKAVLSLDNAGNITGSLTTTYKGSQYDIHDGVIKKTGTEQTKILTEYYDVDNINFKSVSITQDKTELPVTTEKLDIQIAAYVPKTQQSAYLVPNAFNRLSPTRSVTNRKLPVYINRGYTDEDEITYKTPAGYTIDFQPENVELKSPFGTYISRITNSGDQLVYYRKLVIQNGRHAAEQYAAFSEFMNKVSTADRGKVIFRIK